MLLKTLFSSLILFSALISVFTKTPAYALNDFTNLTSALSIDKNKHEERIQSIKKDTVDIVNETINVINENKKNKNKSQEIKDNLKNRSWFRKLITSGIIIILGLLMFLAIRFAINNFEKAFTPKEYIRESEHLLRLKTIGNLLRWLNKIIVISFIFFSILRNFGFDTTFLLAGAGIVGVAVGFGGQYLIRDIITGVFILIEGQYRINDVIRIGEFSGLVEDINLRITTLRDLEGRVIIIPNGEIKTVINLTKDYSYALFNLGVAYKENVDEVIATIKKIAAELRKDKHFKLLITDDLEMFGVDEFADSQVTIKFRIKTLPIKQWDVAREFRRRIKNRFDELGIEIPFPHTTVYFGNQFEKSMEEKV
jgi:moderate conductance mechanosensitive channel